MAEPVDWPALMRMGLGVLRLPPDAFWSMTPGELRRALEGAGVVAAGGQAMGRGRLAELMAAFPDGSPDGGAAGRTPDHAPPPEGVAAAGIRPAAAVHDVDAGKAGAGALEGGRDELR